VTCETRYCAGYVGSYAALSPSAEPGASSVSAREVAIVLMGFTGMRWGELVGPETRYVRPTGVRIEWQLYELDTGELLRCPPKDDSHRTIDTPEWLGRLVSEHVRRTRPTARKCHELTYVFRGHRPPNGADRRPGATLVDVARRCRGLPGNGVGRAHWRRTNFATWLFQPAATGWYPKKGHVTVHPGTGAQRAVARHPGAGTQRRRPGRRLLAAGRVRPDAARAAPYAQDAHGGARHAGQAVDERMGHEDGSVQSRHSHVTAGMRGQLLDGLTAVWEPALAERRTMAAGSPVVVLDGCCGWRTEMTVEIVSEDSPDQGREWVHRSGPYRGSGG
jgi:hypothetical protein